MEKGARQHRLWPHTVRAPKKDETTIIARLKPGAPGGGSPAALAAGRGLRAAGTGGSAIAAHLAGFVANGRVASVTAIFAEGAEARPARTLAEMALVAGAAPMRGARRAAGSKTAGLVALRVARDTNAQRLAKDLAKRSDVEYAFVPPVRTLFGRRVRQSPPDPLASRQWAHAAIRLQHARAAAGFLDAAGLTVAVVDSGIDASHPDLAGAVAEYRNFLSESDKDYVGHGTHVAGIIAAVANNGVGISGVSAARILALKALPRDDGAFDAPAYYRALRYVIGRAQVLNLSLGGERDEAEIDVLADVIDAGVVVVAAMGNEYEEGNPIEYPAAIPQVCAVGATDERDKRASFSNTGRHIDLVAPGVDILSTTPTYRYDDGERTYDSWDGTSMATPHVAGSAALILAKHAGWKPAQVISRLKSSADLVAGARKGSTAYGAGRLNCQKALR
jgi:subtilisin family serine protease